MSYVFTKVKIRSKNILCKENMKGSGLYVAF